MMAGVNPNISEEVFGSSDSSSSSSGTGHPSPSKRSKLDDILQRPASPVSMNSSDDGGEEWRIPSSLPKNSAPPSIATMVESEKNQSSDLDLLAQQVKNMWNAAKQREIQSYRETLNDEQYLRGPDYYSDFNPPEHVLAAFSGNDDTMQIFTVPNIKALIAMQEKLKLYHHASKRPRQLIKKGDVVSLSISGFFYRGIVQKRKLSLRNPKSVVNIPDFKKTITALNKEMRIISNEYDKILTTPKSAVIIKVLEMGRFDTVGHADVKSKIHFKMLELQSAGENTVKMFESAEDSIIKQLTQGLDEIESVWQNIVKDTKIHLVDNVPYGPQEGFAFTINRVLALNFGDGHKYYGSYYYCQTLCQSTEGQERSINLYHCPTKGCSGQCHVLSK